MKLLLTTLLIASSCLNLFGQERPQETRPSPSPERQVEIRDSIRAIGRERFRLNSDKAETGISYEADRALLMPKMERSSIFRIGIPGWLMRLGLQAGKDDFDTDEEYYATKALSKRIRSLRIAAYANNPAYSQQKLLSEYNRFVKRRKCDPVMIVRAPGGGIQIHVKERRGKVKLITLVAYGNEGAALIRLKSKIREKDLRTALALMTETAENSAGVEIDVDE